jgi:hypothetical protein
MVLLHNYSRIKDESNKKLYVFARFIVEYTILMKGKLIKTKFVS